MSRPLLHHIQMSLLFDPSRHKLQFELITGQQLPLFNWSANIY